MTDNRDKPSTSNFFFRFVLRTAQSQVADDEQKKIEQRENKTQAIDVT